MENVENIPRPEEYEKIRKRTFRNEWKKDFPWIEYDQQNNVMYCSACCQFPRLADKHSIFFTGNIAFRKHHIGVHGKSSQHSRCEAAMLTARCPRNAPMDQQICQMEAGQWDQMMKIFNLTHYTMKSEIPFTSFPGLVEIHKKNSVEMGNRYSSDKAVARLVLSQSTHLVTLLYILLT